MGEIWSNGSFFGICSDEAFKTKNLTANLVKAFFNSGQVHINHLLDILTSLSKTVLDFGCGTGKLLIPLAAVAEKVVGIDVSKSMLSEVRKY